MSLLWVSFNGIAAESSNPIPINGILDLRGEVIDEHTYINLNGEWRFHWQ